MKHKFSCIVLFSLSLSHPTVLANHCIQILSKVQEHSRTLSLRQFTETPGEGWTVLAYKGCYREASTLIADYAEHNGWTVNLQWHQLQMLALAGNYTSAILIGEQILAAEPTTAANNPFLFQEFVAGTVAFLKNDEAELHYYRDKLAAGKDFKPNAINLKVLESLAEDLTRTYYEAYAAERQKINASGE
ncbi:hypothetical protein ABC502_16940 [Alkalimonas sp. NCh-2]|uniref:hypothetical protein n=1 Tax=Alkalimonas sp. NCh-2 TaxID=3144846 RepID=UPI0031F6A262